MWFLHTGYYSHMWIYVIHRRMSFSVWFVYSLIIFQWFIYFHMWIFYDSFFFMCLFTWFICLHGLLFSCDFLFNSFIFICEILFTPLFLTWFSTWLIYFHFFLTINFSCEFFTRFLYFPDFFFHTINFFAHMYSMEFHLSHAIFSDEYFFFSDEHILFTWCHVCLHEFICALSEDNTVKCIFTCYCVKHTVWAHVTWFFCEDSTAFFLVRDSARDWMLNQQSWGKTAKLILITSSHSCWCSSLIKVIRNSLGMSLGKSDKYHPQCFKQQSHDAPCLTLIKL